MPAKSKAAERAKGYKIDNVIDAQRLAELKAEEGDDPGSEDIAVMRAMLERAINSGGPAEKFAHSVASLRKLQMQYMRERGLLVEKAAIFDLLKAAVDLMGLECWKYLNGGQEPKSPAELGYPIEYEVEGLRCIRSAPPDPPFVDFFDNVLCPKIADLIDQREKELGA